MDELDFELRGEYITLDALLKVTGLAPSGGRAKMLIAEGEVLVDGAVELRKTCKIRGGQRVLLGDAMVTVRNPI
jgi:ribosome-associated protein